ncbi:MAG: hypothetical protein JAZ05_16305, partial [Candidatus Thiodiazotropha taylori]|nr:hypothetical protein [Candidatus Thiodiazotropha taylori]MCW4293580.1 hypothetical protein [Candidatus Thiodiazotropha taylori]
RRTCDQVSAGRVSPPVCKNHRTYLFGLHVVSLLSCLRGNQPLKKTPSPEDKFHFPVSMAEEISNIVVTLCNQSDHIPTLAAQFEACRQASHRVKNRTKN